MRKVASTFFLTCFTWMAAVPLHADAPAAPAPSSSDEQPLSDGQQKEAPFSPFTGRVTREKVRLRVQPALDAPILREFHRGDLMIVLGETEDFYAIQPPEGTKAYIFRTFVLDDTIEGNHVNVRLEPSVESPIIAQLNSGEHVRGAISQQNNKWLEIIPPSSTRFYVSKDYVENIGDETLLGKLEKRRQDADQLLRNAEMVSQREMQKPFDQINLDLALQNVNILVKDYADFPEQAEKAKSMMAAIQNSYSQKQIAYLKEKAQNADTLQSKAESLKAELQTQQQRYSQLQNKLQAQPAAVPTMGETIASAETPQMTERMAAWTAAENALYEHWKVNQPELTWDEFYHLQQQNAVTLKGIIEPYNPYNRMVKNKPGDYVLINPATNLPIAYLYSTKVNLLEKIGHEVTLEAYLRPNNNFAFQAFFVLSIN